MYENASKIVWLSEWTCEVRNNLSQDVKNSFDIIGIANNVIGLALAYVNGFDNDLGTSVFL